MISAGGAAKPRRRSAPFAPPADSEPECARI